MPAVGLRTNIAIRFTDLGVLFPATVSFAEWRKAASELQQQHKSLLFWLGDLFNEGQKRFGDNEIAEIVELYSAETIMRAERVCRAIPYERRRNVGFSLHQAVENMSVEDQDDLLLRCEREGWTREAMRDAVRQKKAEYDEVKRLAEMAARAARGGPSHDDMPRQRPAPERTAAAPQAPDEAEEEAGEVALATRAASGAVVPFPGTTATTEVLPPDPGPLMKANDAAAALASLVPNFPPNLGRMLTALLAERELLLRLYKSVGIALEMGFSLSPGCRAAYENVNENAGE